MSRVQAITEDNYYKVVEAEKERAERRKRQDIEFREAEKKRHEKLRNEWSASIELSASRGSQVWEVYGYDTPPPKGMATHGSFEFSRSKPSDRKWFAAELKVEGFDAEVTEFPPNPKKREQGVYDPDYKLYVSWAHAPKKRRTEASE